MLSCLAGILQYNVKPNLLVCSLKPHTWVPAAAEIIQGCFRVALPIVLISPPIDCKQNCNPHPGRCSPSLCVCSVSVESTNDALKIFRERKITSA